MTLSGLTLTLWNDCMNWEIEHNYQSLINQEKWKASLTLRTLLSLSGPPSLSCSVALLSCFRSVVFNQPLVDVDIDWGSVICSGLVACQDQTNICLCVCVCASRACMFAKSCTWWAIPTCTHTRQVEPIVPFLLDWVQPLLRSSFKASEIHAASWACLLCVYMRESVCMFSLRGSCDKGREARDCYVITLFTCVSSA